MYVVESLSQTYRQHSPPPGTTTESSYFSNAFRRMIETRHSKGFLFRYLSLAALCPLSQYHCHLRIPYLLIKSSISLNLYRSSTSKEIEPPATHDVYTSPISPRAFSLPFSQEGPSSRLPQGPRHLSVPPGQPQGELASLPL